MLARFTKLASGVVSQGFQGFLKIRGRVPTCLGTIRGLRNAIISTFCTSPVCLPRQPRCWFALLFHLNSPQLENARSTFPRWPSPVSFTKRSHSQSKRSPLYRSSFDHQSSSHFTHPEARPSNRIGICHPNIGAEAMLASVNPSTAGFSVFSTPVSIPSSTSSHAGAPTTRKRGRGTQEAKISQKRRKVIGRPKNGWTASRRRKLVRLYLMTNLEVNEIAKVLRTENFKPWYAPRSIRGVKKKKTDKNVLANETSKLSSQPSYKPDQARFDQRVIRNNVFVNYASAERLNLLSALPNTHLIIGRPGK